MSVVTCVDCGTLLEPDEYKEYATCMALLMGAAAVEVLGTATNCRGLGLVVFKATGSVPHMAIKRLDLMHTDFTVKWYDDAKDQGYLDGVDETLLLNNEQSCVCK